jgi:S-adenosylmethionine/arginine decarboxylase-like enzyme
MTNDVTATFDRLTAILNEYCKKFDLEVLEDTDFAFYRDGVITYTVVVTERFDRMFLNYCETNFPLIHAPIFLWSLFHEIGHAMTDDEIDDDVYEFCVNTKLGLNGENDEDTMTYFDLPDERAATEWGYYYMLNHEQEVTELWDRIRPLIQNLHLTIGE